MHPTRLARIVGPALALALVTTACADDEDAALGAEACDAYAAVGASFFGDPSTVPGLLEDLEAAAPDALRDDVETYADGLTAGFEGDEAAMSAPAFVEASEALGDAVLADCEAGATLEVDGVDYGFAGLPDQVDEGRVAIRFTNATEMDEAHELFVARKNDGVTESLDELLALPEDEVFQKLVPTAVVFSEIAGGEATALVDLEAGDYVAFCMIPAIDDGAPHAMKGMAGEFTVS